MTHRQAYSTVPMKSKTRNRQYVIWPQPDSADANNRTLCEKRLSMMAPTPNRLKYATVRSTHRSEPRVSRQYSVRIRGPVSAPATYGT